MKLSLSGRLIEVKYRYCEMDVPDFMRFAKECGYDAVELRATQITADTTQEEVRTFRRVADELGLEVSAVFAPGGVSTDDAGLRQLEKFTGIVQILGCDTLKTWIGDVDWTQRVCELLLPRGMTLISQTHTGGPLETVDLCRNTMRRVDRENFGLQYDPCNFFEVEEEYGEEAVKRLGGSIRQLSVQNSTLARPEDPDVWEHEGRHYKRCLLGDPAGLDYASVFRGLRAIGFDGYVTVNEPKPALMETQAFAKHVDDQLRQFLATKTRRLDKVFFVP